jgi:hypothetical protein
MPGPSRSSKYETGFLSRDDPCGYRACDSLLRALESSGRSWDVCTLAGCAADWPDTTGAGLCTPHRFECKYCWDCCVGGCAAGNSSYQGQVDSHPCDYGCLCWVMLRCAMVFPHPHVYWWSHERYMGLLASAKDRKDASQGSEKEYSNCRRPWGG